MANPPGSPGVLGPPIKVLGSRVHDHSPKWLLFSVALVGMGGYSVVDNQRMR